ncbi:MAG: gfo/Idh/MocA family oxidoreductase, partial [Planctomycetota bacterium]|nr:gfo/Idh/MocA family oxidoreductase [Planctomycetota bacterium]
GRHEMDKARWAIPNATLPKSVFSLGGRFGYKDQGQTPNTQLTVYTYGDTILVFEVCGLVGGKKDAVKGSDESKVARVSNDFVYEAGTVVEGNKFFPKDSTKAADMPKVEFKLGPGSGPFGNFIAAVKSRRKEDLNAPFLEGHYSAAICHLGNISYRLGKDDYVNAAWDRLQAHLE